MVDGDVALCMASTVTLCWIMPDMRCRVTFRNSRGSQFVDVVARRGLIKAFY